MSGMTLEQARDLLASWLGGSEACLDAPKVAELSAMVSAIDAHLAQNAQGDGEVIGYLNVIRFRHENGMVNHDFDYTADLPDGNYKLYTHAERASVPDGWVMVPREPTAKMIAAGSASLKSDVDFTRRPNMPTRERAARNAYVSMLAAATPQPEDAE